MVNDFARYDYAWKTPGWTVQNPSYPVVSGSYGSPGLPDDVSKVRVYGKFYDGSTGRKLEGVLRIRTKHPHTHVPTMSQFAAMRVREKFIGEFEVFLPATDDPDFQPQGVPYEALLTVNGYAVEFSFLLPADPGEYNILDLIPPENAPDPEFGFDQEALADYEEGLA